MGRQKTYNTEDTLNKIGLTFIANGYNGTSIDDLVKQTGLLRGSLYASFGSKQGMFIAALKRGLEGNDDKLKWGLLIVSMLEVTSKSIKVSQIVQSWYSEHEKERIAEKIGMELLKRSKLIE